MTDANSALAARTDTWQHATVKAPRPVWELMAQLSDGARVSDDGPAGDVDQNLIAGTRDNTSAPVAPDVPKAFRGVLPRHGCGIQCQITTGTLTVAADLTE